MAVQVSYPGVYIEEFAPGAPIQGVGTNTAAFIGVASGGPIETPTAIQSWDAFVATFGGFITDGPAGYLAPAVFGFFLNGGTTCYVVRAATASKASVALVDRGGAPQTVLTARALTEGPAGNSLGVQISDSSRMADRLNKAGIAATTLAAFYAETAVTTLDATRLVLTVADNSKFVVGDVVQVDKAPDKAVGTIAALSGTNTITLAAPLGPGNFAAGTVRTADLTPGTKQFRVIVPAGVSLSRDLLPRGSLVQIAQGGTTETGTVSTASGDTVTLEKGLTGTFSYADKAKLPTFGSLEFDLTTSSPAVSFKFLSMNRAHPNYWENVVSSAVLEVIAPDVPPNLPGPDRRPKVGTFPLIGGVEDDRGAARSAIVNNPSHYLDLLKPILDISLVAIPGETDMGVQQAVISHCEDTFFRFGVLDSIRGIEQPDGISAQLGGLFSERGYAALYYPWISVVNPSTGAGELWPPSGHITGIIARTDATLGVFKAPANTNVRGALGLERRLTDQQQGPLNLKGINVLRVFPGESAPLVWGARTIAADRNWQYINIRRLFIFLEQSIQEGIRWAVFEPNNLSLWQKLKRTISEFLERVWRDGGLFGATAKEAFYVRIDEAINPESDRKLGRLTIEIGVQPAYPAEFIVVRIGIWDGGAQVSEG